MEENLQHNCPNCSKLLPQIVSYFCGACLTQIRCKSCNSLLEKDSIGCIYCGTPKVNGGIVSSNEEKGINTFRFHETATDRIIEASFSDNVGKEVTSILKDTAGVKMLKGINNVPHNPNDLIENAEELFSDAEIIDEKSSPESIQSNEMEILTSSEKEEFPAMKYIVMNNLPSSESEWIIVYAFYASNFGQETFTRKDILNMYEESGRKTNTRVGNLGSSIKNAVTNRYVNPINNNDFSIVEKGIEKAKEIIGRTSGSIKVRTTSKSKKENASENSLEKENSKKKVTSGNKPKVLANIDFYPEGEKSLVDFTKEYNPKNDNERNLLFTYYLSKTLNIKEISLDHLFTCYDAVNYKLPENMLASLNNTKTRKKWLSTDKSNIEITTKGLNEVKAWHSKQKE